MSEEGTDPLARMVHATDQFERDPTAGIPLETLAPRTTTADAAWQALVDAAKGWAQHLDQWDKFRFATDYGPIYVTIARGSEHPSTFEEVP